MKALIDSDIPCYSIAYICKDEPWGVVEDTVDNYINNILYATAADSFECYLTGKGCWRREKYPDYKGQRKPEKPEWYHDIRDYFIEEYDAIVTEDGFEADDYIAIQQRLYPERYIVCSSDKDFNTVPGWHYNPKWNVKYKVSKEDANLWFWCQMIMGDTSDNIKGIPGKGKMAAYKLLSEAEDPKLAVIAAYREHFGDDFEAEYNKNYELLKIG